MGQKLLPTVCVLAVVSFLFYARRHEWNGTVIGISKEGCGFISAL